MSIYSAPTYAMGGDYVMLPGSRLELGPGGQPYETLGSLGTEKAIQKKSAEDAGRALRDPNERAASVRELARMKRSLCGWLKYRAKNQEVLSGRIKSVLPPAELATVMRRAMVGEKALATDLHFLLAQVYPNASLPDPGAPGAAVQLAKIALGEASPKMEKPVPQGIFPLLIVGTVGAVVLFTATSYISNRAEVEKEKARLAYCKSSNNCTDYGFWLKSAGVVVLGYFAWEKLGVKERVATLQKKIGG